MTKLDFKIGKSEGSNEQQHHSSDNDSATAESTANNTNNEQQSKSHFEDVLTTLGLNVKHDGTGPHIGFSCIGMDWAFMLQVANAQATLSILLIVCLTSSMFLTGYRFISSAWATYLLSCAYIGMRAGRWQSYSHAIAFCGMCTFQSFVYMSTMCWFFYSLYTLNSNTQSYEFIHSATSDTALVFALGEMLCIMGTVLTGIFGLIGCCRGFGRLLHAQEKMILDYQNVLIGAYDSARRLNAV
uniref:Transmembrane protein n=1 Tax=Elaeophora elaphi TaxID=1147741 RepID=A0A0R3RPN5_9BILA